MFASSAKPLHAIERRGIGMVRGGRREALGVVSLDVADRDYVWTVLARDAKNRFRGVNHEINIPTQAQAEERLALAFARHASTPG